MSPPRVVNLPELLRAADGHVLYEYGSLSICPNHKFCAYTGTEEDRCPVCHRTIEVVGDDEYCSCTDLPPGRTSPCLCVRCGELFTSLTAFTKHKHSTGKCYKPWKRGLVLVDQNGWELWANPGNRPPRED